MTLYMRDRENFEQGIEQGIVQNRFDTIQLLVKSGMQLNDKAMTVLGVSEEEYQEAKESLS